QLFCSRYFIVQQRNIASSAHVELVTSKLLRIFRYNKCDDTRDAVSKAVMQINNIRNVGSVTELICKLFKAFEKNAKSSFHRMDWQIICS
ncbi:MAG: hypothetical protein AB2693_23240, partial [Candidatus Thiodiazotropha sp.]